MNRLGKTMLTCMAITAIPSSLFVAKQVHNMNIVQNKISADNNFMRPPTADDKTFKRPVQMTEKEITKMKKEIRRTLTDNNINFRFHKYTKTEIPDKYQLDVYLDDVPQTEINRVKKLINNDSVRVVNKSFKEMDRKEKITQDLGVRTLKDRLRSAPQENTKYQIAENIVFWWHGDTFTFDFMNGPRHGDTTIWSENTVGYKLPWEKDEWAGVRSKIKKIEIAPGAGLDMPYYADSFFANFPILEDIDFFDYAHFDKVKTARYMFANDPMLKHVSSVTEVPGDNSLYRTESMMILDGMFYNSHSIQSVDFTGISGARDYETNKDLSVTDMFKGANNIRSIKVLRKTKLYDKKTGANAELHTPQVFKEDPKIGGLYTGRWVSVDKPSLVFSTIELSKLFDGTGTQVANIGFQWHDNPWIEDYDEFRYTELIPETYQYVQYVDEKTTSVVGIEPFKMMEADGVVKNWKITPPIGYSLVDPAQATQAFGSYSKAIPIRTIKVKNDTNVHSDFAFSPEKQNPSGETPVNSSLIVAKYIGLEQLNKDEAGVNTNGYKEDIVIPKTFSNTNVTGIADFAFSNKENNDYKDNLDIIDSIKSVEIPDTIKTIGYGAFAYNQLKKINIPASTVVKDNAFSHQTGVFNIETNIDTTQNINSVDKFMNKVKTSKDFEATGNFDWGKIKNVYLGEDAKELAPYDYATDTLSMPYNWKDYLKADDKGQYLPIQLETTGTGNVGFDNARLRVKTAQSVVKVHYVDKDGKELAPSLVKAVDKNSTFSTTAIDIKGYHVDGNNTINQKITDDAEFTFKYLSNSASFWKAGTDSNPTKNTGVYGDDKTKDYVYSADPFMDEVDSEKVNDTTKLKVLAKGIYGKDVNTGIKWYITETSELHISGGVIDKFYTGAPWSAYTDKINKIVIEGKLSLQENAANSLFQGLNKLKTVDNGENLDLSQATNLGNMFYGNTALETLDVSKWDTSKVTNMDYLFSDNSNLKLLDVSNWNTSNVITMYNTFSGDNALSVLNVSNWDVSKVTNMGYLFFDMPKVKELDVSKWKTSNLTNIDAMFYNDQSLQTLDFSNFDTSKVTSANDMFNTIPKVSSIVLGDNFVKNLKVKIQLPNQTGKAKWRSIGNGTAEKPQGDFLKKDATSDIALDNTVKPGTYVLYKKTKNEILDPDDSTKVLPKDDLGTEMKDNTKNYDELAIDAVPNFDFGEHMFTYDNTEFAPLQNKNSNKNLPHFIQITNSLDNSKNFNLTVKDDGFKDIVNNNNMMNAKINLTTSNVITNNSKDSSNIIPTAKFDITNDETTILKAPTSSLDGSFQMQFKPEDTKLVIPQGEMKVGDFSDTITWSLNLAD